jgi:hypothetical protein
MFIRILLDRASHWQVGANGSFARRRCFSGRLRTGCRSCGGIHGASVSASAEHMLVRRCEVTAARRSCGLPANLLGMQPKGNIDLYDAGKRGPRAEGGKQLAGTVAARRS